jgi:hypothetical protein
MQEIWKPLKDITLFGDNYEVSNLGRVRHINKRWRDLKPTINSHGYPRVLLYLNGNCKTVKVHKLVALVFIPNDDNLPVINHIDGNKVNNEVTNLEWVTYSENNLHAYKTGLKPKKLSDEDREYIKTNFKPYSKEFGSTIYHKYNLPMPVGHNQHQELQDPFHR